MRVRLASAFVIVVISVIGAGQGARVRVLFVGNLTLANGQPAMVEQVSREAGGVAIEATVIAQGGVSLEDHWNRGDLAESRSRAFERIEITGSTRDILHAAARNAVAASR